ncbi:Nitrogen regulation protein NtrB [hydrothermal vent metagenome]|uniref:Nitrogen regulation protein NtrB n=1 Tax=hydrothermal vent metagenome TaxID=652676 RepID=A0A3B1CF78_9ZZZZ
MKNRSKRFESILSSFTDAVIIIDADGKVEWVNSSAQELISLSHSHMAGADIQTIFKRSPSIMKTVNQSLSDGVVFTDHDALYHPNDGGETPVGVSIRPMDEGEGRGAVIVLRDLTSLKSLEKFMAVNEKMGELSALAAGMAHEIKNPLGGIRGAAQLINIETADTSQKELSELIVSEVDRINRLVVDLLAVNQPGDFTKEPVNIYPILDDCLRLLKASMEKKKIAVERYFDPSLPGVIGSADKLRQIFLNIIKNGVEACDEGGEITLSTQLAWDIPHTIKDKNRRYILIEVKDQGGGIDDEARKRLFTPYFSSKKSGVGLGLSITMGLVQAHDGYLDIGNRKNTKGAVAQIFLPYKIKT